MNSLRHHLNKHLSGKKALILFVFTNLVYVLMLAVTIPGTMAYASGLKLLDMLPQGYDAAYIQNLFCTLGEEGRYYYLYRQIPVDMIYPGLFGISYCLIMGYFLNKLQKLDSFWFYMCLLPIIAGVADYLENLGIINLLVNYPNLSSTIMSLTNAFSIIKSLTTSLFFIALIITMIALGIKTLKRKNAETNAV